jgi:hypothetical protein
VLGQLFGQTWQRVSFEAMFRTRCERLARVDTDEAVAADGLGGGSGFEEK